MKQTRKDINSTKNELKDMIIDSVAQQKEMIDKNAEDTDIKIENLKTFLVDSLEKQNNRIEEISIMKGTGGINIGEPKENEEIELNADLLPPLPQIEKKAHSSRKETEETIDDIIGENLKDLDNKTPKEKVKESPKPKLRQMKISLIDIDTESNKEMIIQEEKRIANLENLVKKKNNQYHVMIGLTRAYMITGAYAPAFSAGEEEPLPVLLQAEGDILIANDDTENIDRCLLIGSAKGNMNSKTADIRLLRISCSLNEGKQMIEGEISGWVIGENGIPGVPGELLHKNGAWLAQTFVSGFMQTFSDALSNSGTTQISFGGSVGGQQQEVPLGTAVENNAAAAAGGGLSTVFGKLGEYYLKMAEQIFPVIEVKAGRTVNILLRGGENLQVKDFNKVDIGEIEEKYEEEELNRLEKLEEKEYTSDIKSSNSNIINTKAPVSEQSDSSDLLITE